MNQTIFTFDQQRYIDSVKKGSYDPQWLKDKRLTWGIRATMKDPERGLDSPGHQSGVCWRAGRRPTLQTMAPSHLRWYSFRGAGHPASSGRFVTTELGRSPTRGENLDVRTCRTAPRDVSNAPRFRCGNRLK
jgi:hypothetical protein